MSASLFPVLEFRDKSVGLADLLPYGVDLGDGIIGDHDGSFTVFYSMRGPDLLASSPEMRQSHHFLFARALNTLREGWMLHTFVGRGRIEKYPLHGNFTSRTAWLMEEERIAGFNAGNARFFNDMAIAFTYLPGDENYNKAAKFFRDSQDEDLLPGDLELENFLTALRGIENLCGKSLRLERLDRRTINYEDEGPIEVDDRLSFLEKMIGGNKQDVRALPYDANISAAVAQPVRTGSRLRVGDDCIAVVTIDNVPDTARTTLMRGLYSVDQVCDIVVRWIVRDPENIAPEMRDTRKKLWRDRKSISDSVKSNATSELFIDETKVHSASDVNTAVSASSNGEAYGYISFAIILRQRVNRAAGRRGERDAWKALDDGVGRVMGALRTSKFTPRHEVENVFEAWLMTLPGMGFCQVRKGITGSQQISYLSALTSVWVGSLTAPCSFYPKGSSALTYVGTEGRAPMALNLHVGDVGHTIVFGATGGGKSTAFSFMAAQHERYGPRSRRILFDYQRSMKTLACSMENGVHLDFFDSNIRLAIFADINEPGGIDRAHTFVSYLLSCNGIEPQKYRSDIYNALKAMAHGRTKPSMLSLASAPFLNPEVKSVLEQYTRGHAGAVLDGEDDVFPDASTICIELEHVMAMEDAYKKPLLVALMNRIEKLFDGRPTLWILDEFWKPLNDEILGKVIGEKIKTVRKANVAMVFGTQSVSDLDGHVLEATLKGPDVPTKIFTRNPEAKIESTSRLLRSAGLADWEIDMLAGAAIGEYYITSPEGRRLFSYGMGNVALAFCSFNDKDSITEVDRMRADDEAFTEKFGWLPEMPWQARLIEKRVKGPQATGWAKAWVRGQHDDGHIRFGPSTIQKQRNLHDVTPSQERIATAV